MLNIDKWSFQIILLSKFSDWLKSIEGNEKYDSNLWYKKCLKFIFIIYQYPPYQWENYKTSFWGQWTLLCRIKVFTFHQKVVAILSPKHIFSFPGSLYAVEFHFIYSLVKLLCNCSISIYAGQLTTKYTGQVTDTIDHQWIEKG